MSDPNATVSNAFAVVATAVITPDADVEAIKGSGGVRLPVIMYVSTDEDQCKRMVNRLIDRASRVLSISKDGMLATKPVLGVVPIVMSLPRQRATPQSEASDNGTPATRGRRRQKA